jgi:peptidoglycan/xylan/chitin deacetylase (PgdA/CDA1 family)
VTTLPTSAPVVALTFDGGASDAGVPSILATLSQQGVRATFFVTGDFARRYPARVQAMAAAGHLVGNHSDTHPDFTTLSAVAQIGELARAQAAIVALTGADPAPWFRFPFGASNSTGVATVNAQGYATIGWTVDTLGWKGTSGGQSADSVVARVVAGARPGEIVLLHVGANPDDGTTLDADALPTVIARLRAGGYGFIGLDGRG